ncbi:ketopantoate reductase family protein [Arhodomonas sp. SL1]|uniref:ketopantoate reductase family protein n=1 Tax=Arhodomonas sp. SL1 TaxID=3425691 RepID=UPI003F881FAB
MRVVIIGIGGIGGYYAARLQRTGNEVIAVARGRQLEALQHNGLRVEHPEFHFAEAMTAVDMPGLHAHDPAAVDAVLLATKSASTPEIARGLREWFDGRGHRTAVLSLQNGVDNEPLLAEALGDDLVIGGLSIRVGTHVTAPGVVEATGPGQVTAGVWPDRASAPAGIATERLPHILSGLEVAGVPVQETDDIRRELWRKLVINNGVNPISAVTGWDSWHLTHDERIAPLLKRLMRETASVARADGVTLNERDVEEMFAIIHDLDPIKTSMLVDREHGRPLELDAICGAVLERARRLGEDTPATEMVSALLERGIWAGAPQPDPAGA